MRKERIRFGKRIIGAVALLSLLVNGVTFAGINNLISADESAQEDRLLGDVNNDKKVDLLDAQDILSYALGIKTPSSDEIIAFGDMDGNEVITLNDADLVLRAALGIVDDAESVHPDATYKPITDNIGGPAFPTPEPEIEPTPTPTPIPTPEPTPLPPKTRKLADVEALEENIATGEAVSVLSLNGASFDDTKKMITFGTQTKGVQMLNPFAGRVDLRQTVEEVTSLEAEDGKVNVWSLKGATLDGSNQLDIEKVHRATWSNVAENVTYTFPEWENGVSISFWAKLPEKKSKTPLLVFENNNHIVSIWADGSVYFRDGVMKNNMLDNTSDNILGDFGEWNHYTVTFANDWITVYVNGQENLFDILWLSRKIIGGFNDGFLTRYNYKFNLSLEEYEADEREYYKRANMWQDGMAHDNFCVFANQRFRGCNSKGKLMIDYMTEADTNMWIGGTETAVGQKYTTFGTSAGVQIADVKAYEKELTPQEVSANYKFLEKNPEVSGEIVTDEAITVEPATGESVTVEPVTGEAVTGSAI